MESATAPREIADGVGVGLETATRAGLFGDGFDERDLPEIIAVLGLGKVNLDRTDLNGLDRIMDGNGGMGVGRGIVRLPHFGLDSTILRDTLDEIRKIRIGPIAVDLRRTNSEQVEVRPVDNEDLHGRQNDFRR